MKEILLAQIESKQYRPLTYEELLHIYKDKIRLDEALDELINDGKVFITTNYKYQSCKRAHLYKAQVVRVKDHFAFATILEDDTDIYIAKEDLMGALINDMVLIYVAPGTTKGEVISVLERVNSRFVGEIKIKGKYDYVIPDQIVINIPIIVEGSDYPYAQGSKVVAQITNYHQDYIEVRVVEVLGHKNDPGVDILSVVKEYQVPYEFPTPVLDEARNVKDTVLEEELEGRKDFRGRLIVTIDGDDSKDFDDAVEVILNDDGTYYLGVHIADVSYYVKENSLIDLEALSRGNSIYLADRVIPMLPFNLSNGICSLNPNVDRLVLSCLMTVNQNGEVIDYEITKGVIRSAYRLTYNRVNALLTRNELYEDDNLNNMLFVMRDLADILRKSKQKKGMLNLDVDEPKIIVDETGKCIDVKVRERGVSEGIIEQFMILANETVASHLYFQNLPNIYRVHPQPQLKKIRHFAQLIKPLGYTLTGDQNGIHPSQLQKILDESKENENSNIIASLLLRSLPKAFYSGENLKHFGIASSAYSHFTSPIRRYSDLLLHRLIKEYMKNEIIDYTPLIAKIVYIAEQVSVTERKAIEIEREVNAMKMAEYMEDHIGEEFEGRVSGFNQVGVYVELDNTVEGFVRFNSINEYEDYYYDEQRMIAVSSKGRVVTLGERVLVRVESASKKLRHIDFSIVRFFKTKKENKEQKQLLDKEKKGRKKTNKRSENQTIKRKRHR
ncbi:TPA: ribonuclease R [bacterium]|nr:ribonuclease R [bacterium]